MIARVFSLAIAAFILPSASGEIIAFRFEGTITTNRFTSGAWAAAEVGDDFLVEYRFDTTTPDSDPGMQHGRYEDCISDFVVNAGPSTELGTVGIIEVSDTPNDGYVVRVPLVDGLMGYVLLAAEGSAPLSNDTLPTNIDLDAWASAYFLILPTDGPVGDRIMLGTINSFAVVPAPGAGLLAAAAGVAVLRRRR